MEYDNQGGAFSHEWVCGDCLYKRDHPDAAPAVRLPRERSKRIQKESLFDDFAGGRVQAAAPEKPVGD